MFKEKKSRVLIRTFIQIALLFIIIVGYFIEYISYFLITNTFTFLQLPLKSASLVEFFIFLILSSIICILSVILISMNKYSIKFDNIICILIIVLNLFKLSFYIPSITLDKTYLFYILKQYIPLITNGITIILSMYKLSDNKSNI
ncbi:MAG: hypothetical protein ACOWWH_06490 [Eubacteriaceae bacterium]